MKTIGLKLSVEDTNTGAQATYHRIEYYSVDLRAKQCTAMLAGYVSEKTQADGRSPLMNHNVTVQGLPLENESDLEWLYSEVSKPAPELAADVVNGMMMPGAVNVFSGAELAQ